MFESGKREKGKRREKKKKFVGVLGGRNGIIPCNWPRAKGERGTWPEAGKGGLAKTPKEA